MKLKKLKIIALLMVFLIINIPLVQSVETFYEYKEKLPESTPDVGVVQDVGEQCVLKNEKTTKFVKQLSGDTWSEINNVFTMLKSMCDIGSAINGILSGLNSIFGGTSESYAVCCPISNIPIFAWMKGVCSGINAIYQIWENIYTGFFGKICCVINCNWCKGQNCFKKLDTDKGEDSVEGTDTDSEKSDDEDGEKKPTDGEDKESTADKADKVSSGLGTFLGGLTYVFSGGFAGDYVYSGVRSNIDTTDGNLGWDDLTSAWAISVDPYDNIYAASICMCIPAFLFNVEKLKAVYTSYNCCLQQACVYGVSTESCDKMLGEATCAYWEGSALTTVIQVITGFLMNAVQKGIYKVVEIFVGRQALKTYGCALSWWNLLNLPQMVESLSDGIRTVDMSGMSCEDIGMEQVNDIRMDLFNNEHQSRVDYQSGVSNLF
ncbi:hypothetical protein KY321_00370, partial [Candidatus Woesearchaeota archaeon]|nr:hypothetical protein [Candidatus Woesearchaeota archaeon]